MFTPWAAWLQETAAAKREIGAGADNRRRGLRAGAGAGARAGPAVEEAVPLPAVDSSCASRRNRTQSRPHGSLRRPSRPTGTRRPGPARLDVAVPPIDRRGLARAEVPEA